MGRLEDLAISYANNARCGLSDALTSVFSLDDEGTLGNDDLGRIADAYHRMTWWQQVTDLTHGREVTVDGGTALVTVRRHAQEFLISARPVTHGGLFAQAMAESRRHGAQEFLTTTQNLADALTSPPEPDVRSADGTTGHTTSPAGSRSPASVTEYRP